MNKKITAALLSLGFLLVGSSVFAQTTDQIDANSVTSAAVGLKFSPPIIELDLRPGQTYTELVKLENRSASAQEFYPALYDFVPRGEEGGQTFVLPEVGDETYSLSAWANFSKEPIALDAGETSAMIVAISVPENAEPGGRYAGLLFGNNPAVQASGNIVSLEFLTGPIILGTVEGDATIDLSLAEYSSNAGFYEYLPVNFLVRLNNAGNVHVKPTGYISLRNMFGTVTEQLDLNPKTVNVLPNSTRRFDVTWDEKTFRFGKYTAELSVFYGEETSAITSTVSFWILPWKVIVAVTLAVLIVILLIITLLRRYNAWIVKKAIQQQKEVAAKGVEGNADPDSTPAN